MHPRSCWLCQKSELSYALHIICFWAVKNRVLDGLRSSLCVFLSNINVFALRMTNKRLAGETQLRQCYARDFYFLKLTVSAVSLA